MYYQSTSGVGNTEQSHYIWRRDMKQVWSYKRMAKIPMKWICQQIFLRNTKDIKSALKREFTFLVPVLEYFKFEERIVVNRDSGNQCVTYIRSLCQCLVDEKLWEIAKIKNITKFQTLEIVEIHDCTHFQFTRHIEKVKSCQYIFVHLFLIGWFSSSMYLDNVNIALGKR